MGTVFVNAFETTVRQITIYWNELETQEEKGDSEILSYTLAFSKDAGLTWELLTGIGTGGVHDPFPLTQFTKDTYIEAGLFYSFKVLASNIYGDGPYSDVYTFKAAEEPV